MVVDVCRRARRSLVERREGVAGYLGIGGGLSGLQGASTAPQRGPPLHPPGHLGYASPAPSPSPMSPPPTTQGISVMDPFLGPMGALDSDLVKKYGVSKKAWRIQRQRDGTSSKRTTGSRRKLAQVFKDVPALGQEAGTVVRSKQTTPTDSETANDGTENREVA